MIVVGYLALVPLGYLIHDTFLSADGSGVSLDAFARAYGGDAHAGEMMLNSLWFAIGSAALALLLGTVLAYVQVRTDTRSRGFSSPRRSYRSSCPAFFTPRRGSSSRIPRPDCSTRCSSRPCPVPPPQHLQHLGHDLGAGTAPRPGGVPADGGRLPGDGPLPGGIRRHVGGLLTVLRRITVPCCGRRWSPRPC
ncbi:hypothetical protein ACFQV4_29485 [Streptomyces thermocarboxydus]